MYARQPSQPKRARASDFKKFSAPVAGWVANRALADPQNFTEGQGAAVLDNFFPKATSVILRRGKQAHATLEDTALSVTSLFSYRNGAIERLFGANENTIYDLTSVPFSEDAEIVTEDGDLIDLSGGDWLGWSSTVGFDVMSGFTGGEWIVPQFAATGTVFLIGVNGEDTGFIFDGTTFYPYVSGGVSRLDYDAEVTPFVEGEEITGGTSGATATVWEVVDLGAGAGRLLLTDITGTFEDDETIAGSDGEATADGVPVALVPGPTFDATDLTTADMAYAWVYKNRLFFAQKDSMVAWYTEDVDSVGGTFKPFSMAGVFQQGGNLLFGAAWSLDGAGVDGLSEQCVFVSSLGEVAVYQGNDPGIADAWSKVGLYRIGAPLGKRAFLRGGGDLAIATTVGLVPLSKAIQLDVTALNVATVSYKIADAWSEAVIQRGATDWQCEVWPESKMAVISPPDLIGSSSPVIFVSNTETGAWARYTGWRALCMEVFQGRLYFGSPDGKVFIANVSGNDYGETFSGAVVPLFEDMGSPGSAKIGKIARARVRANGVVNDQVSMLADFDQLLPPAPDATALTGENLWGEAVWGTAVWGEATPTKINQNWGSVGGIGYALAPVYQVTSGAVGPLDAELIDLELTYTTAELVT